MQSVRRTTLVSEWEGLDAFTLLRHAGEWMITSLAYAPGT